MIDGVRVYPTTRRELRIIKELTSRSAFDRVDAGEAEIVEDIDWTSVPTARRRKANRSSKSRRQKVRR